MIHLVAAIDWSLTIAVCALVVTVCALYISVLEVRRNNIPSGRLKKVQCRFVSSVNENNGELFAHFEIVIRNTGIKLIDPEVRLEFVGTDGCGGTSIALHEGKEIRGSKAEFERSMMGAFEWKSYTFKSFLAPMFAGLSNAGKQRASFRVYSQSYLSYEFRIGGWLDRLKYQWNRITHTVHWRFRRTIKANDGSNRLYIPEWLPTFVIRERHLMQFVEHLKKLGLPPEAGE